MALGPLLNFLKPIGIFLVVAVSWVVGAHGQSPQFRAETTAVGVPVLVRSGGRVVTDLTIDDFALTDSDVPQTIGALQGVDAPLDVSIVIQQTRARDSSERTFGSEIEAIRRHLRSTDRLEVVSASDGGRSLIPLGPPISDAVPASERKYSCTTLYDAVVRVLMRPAVYGRQQLLFILTEGEGGGGSATADTAMAVARRSQVSVSVLMIPPRSFGGPPWQGWGNYALCAEAVLAWLPTTRNTLRGISRTPDVELQDSALVTEQRVRLDRLAEVTGGQRLRQGMFGGPITGAVRSLVDDARQRYILYYTPVRVPLSGWHVVRVSVRRPGNFDVSARPGYER